METLQCWLKRVVLAALVFLLCQPASYSAAAPAADGGDSTADGKTASPDAATAPRLEGERKIIDSGSLGTGEILGAIRLSPNGRHVVYIGKKTLAPATAHRQKVFTVAVRNLKTGAETPLPFPLVDGITLPVLWIRMSVFNSAGTRIVLPIGVDADGTRRFDMGKDRMQLAVCDVASGKIVKRGLKHRVVLPCFDGRGTGVIVTIVPNFFGPLTGNKVFVVPLAEVKPTMVPKALPLRGVQMIPQPAGTLLPLRQGNLQPESMCIVDSKTGRKVADLTCKTVLQGREGSMQWTPDGRFCCYADSAVDNRKRRFITRIWDAKTRTEHARIVGCVPVGPGPTPGSIVLRKQRRGYNVINEGTVLHEVPTGRSWALGGNEFCAISSRAGHLLYLKKDQDGTKSAFIARIVMPEKKKPDKPASAPSTGIFPRLFTEPIDSNEHKNLIKRARPEEKKAVITLLKQMGATVKLNDQGWVKEVRLHGVDNIGYTYTPDGLLGPRRVIKPMPRQSGIEGAFAGGMSVAELEALLRASVTVTGAHLEHLKGLTRLETLKLRNVYSAGSGMKYLQGLKNLKHLSLAANNLSDSALTHIKGLTKLETLDLSTNYITDAGLAPLKNTTNLKTLNLRLTLVTGEGLAHLKGLTKLADLSLSATPVTNVGMAHLNELRKLQCLNLSKTRVGDLSVAHIKGLTGLKTLDLSRTEITDATLVHLKGFNNLTELNLDATRVTKAAVQELRRGLPNLKTVSFYENPRYRENLAVLKQAGLGSGADDEGWFTMINVGKAKRADALSAKLAGFVGIEWLSFQYGDITDAGVAHLSGMTSLKQLSLRRTKITDAALVHLKRLKQLRELNLAQTKIGDVGVAELKGLTNLRRLDLASTRVTDVGLAELRGLTNLRHLDLGGTRVADAGLAHVKSLRRLESLDLSVTQVTDEGVEKLQQALPNCRIEHNQ